MCSSDLVDNKPQVTTVGQEFRITVNDPVLENEISMSADYVVLSTGLRPHPTNDKLGEMYKLTRNEDGYFLEAHVKLRPVERKRRAKGNIAAHARHCAPPAPGRSLGHA